MGSLGSLVIKIGADLTQFSSAMQNVNRELKQIGKQMQAVGATMTMTLTAPIAALAAVSLKAAGDIEALKNGLKATLKPGEDLEAEFKRLREVARLPGLGLEEAVRGSVNLQAIGVSAGYARKAMLAMGNAIATVGGGKANFDLAIRGFSQLVNAAKPLQQDLYQIANQVPQINKLLIEAFGTNRAEDLAALGLTGKDVADFLVKELGKLPAAAGGINNAFENMGDSVKLAFYKIGEALNKSFNITGMMDRFSEGLSNLADRFSSLSPEVQKIIFSIAGFAALIGPLLIGLGAMATALSALSLPLIALVAAFSGAVILIITYWDDLIAYFETGDGASIFDSLSESAMLFFGVLKEAFETGTILIKGLWNVFGDFLMDNLSKAFNKIADMIKTELDWVINIIRLFKGIFTGNWALIWESVLNLGKIFLNKFINIIQSTVNLFLDGIGTLTKLMEKLGVGDALVKGFKDARSAMDHWVEGLKFTTTTSEEAKKSLDALTGSWNKLSSTKDSTDLKSGLGDSIGSTKKIGVDNSGASSSAAMGAMAEFATLATVTGAAVSAAFSTGMDGAKNSVVSFAQEASDALMAFGTSEAITIAAERMKQLSDSITQGMQQAAQAMIVGSAEMIGAAIATGSGIEKLPQMLLGTLADLASQVGKTAIGVGIAISGIQAALKTLNPAVAIAGGIALVALAAGVKAALSKSGNKGGGGGVTAFANGGIVSGPTMGLMGEYAGAKRNPEVVAPLDRLQSMMGGSDVNVYGELVLRGPDLVAAIRKQEDRERRGA